jgi:hypothetical protein
MLNESRIALADNVTTLRRSEASTGLHSAWQEFIHYCAELEFGEIEKLKIQDGLPVLAELTRKKVRFGM